VAVPPPTDAEVQAALAALSDTERFREAESRVTRLIPELQTILAEALHAGGWFDEAHESQMRLALDADEGERAAALRTLLAEETRIGMLVGVAVGVELARELPGLIAAP
jgi:hypothetical protein